MTDSFNLTATVAFTVEDRAALRSWLLAHLPPEFGVEPFWSPPVDVRRDLGLDLEDDDLVIEIVVSTDGESIYPLETDEHLVNLLESVLPAYLAAEVDGIDVFGWS